MRKFQNLVNSVCRKLKMKFGKQLELGVYMPWKSAYLSYAKLKRNIKRKAFSLKIEDNSDEEDDGTTPQKSNASGSLEMKNVATSYGSISGESDSLIGNVKGAVQVIAVEDLEDFFDIIEAEIMKVNKFVVGKIAELRIDLTSLSSQQVDPNRTHHTDGDRTFLLRLKDVYIQLVALKKFCALNATGMGTF